MPSEKKRLDLSCDFGLKADDIFADIHAATEEMRIRCEAENAKAKRDAQKEKSRKTSLLLIGIGTIIVLLMSYWIVFAKSGNNNSAAVGIMPAGTQVAEKTTQVKIDNSYAPKTRPVGPPTSGSMGKQGSKVDHPQEGYEENPM